VTHIASPESGAGAKESGRVCPASVRDGTGPADQAATLRRMMHSPSAQEAAETRTALTIAVTSGKGGVGKTNLAVNLAVCLQSRGLATTLADLDVGLANADVLLDVQPRRNLRDVLGGRCRLTEAATTAVNGLSFIAGSSGAEGLSCLDDSARVALADRLTRLPGAAVIFDCAAGIAPAVMTFARAADVVLVVTTPEPTALTDAYTTVKTLLREGYAGSVRLVVNMVESRPEAKDTYGRLRDVCQKFMRFPIADAGYLLHDTHVELGVRQRVPFVLCYPKCPASICVAAIAARLVTAGTARKGQPGLWRRVAGMFT